MTQADPAEAELHAYVDGTLDPLRRSRLERRMARDPALSARIGSDLRISRGLRLLRDRRGAAGRRKAVGRWAIGATAAVSLVASGWLANASFRPAAPISALLVDDAVEAHNAALLRYALYPPESRAPRLQARRITQATGIAVPALPASWQVVDVQLFPSDIGPSLLMTVDDGAGPPISLLAIRARTGASASPRTLRHDGSAVSYWQRGETVIALTSTEPARELEDAARRLAESGGFAQS